MEVLQKDRSTPLPQQLYKILLERISSGRYPAGKKLDSIRVLAREFKISDRVVNQALELLEKDSLIIREPARGVFVSRCNTVDNKPLRVILVFPEVGILPEVLPVGNWHANTEIYRGMLEVGIAHNTHIHLEYFPEAEDNFALNGQLQRLAGYDAAIFYGDQRRKLRSIAGNEVAVVAAVQFGGPAEYYEHELAVGYSDEELVECLVNGIRGRGYRKCGCISVPAWEDDVAFLHWRMMEYCRLGQAAGLEMPEDALLEVALPTVAAEDEIVAFLRREKPDFLFYNSDDLKLLYNAVSKLSLLPGREIDFMYIGASSVCPICSRVTPPFRQIGREMISRIVDYCRWKRPLPSERIFLPPQIITGNSTGWSHDNRTDEM